MLLFAAATGMRPGEWVALEQRDIDRAGRVAYVNRFFSKGRTSYGSSVGRTSVSAAGRT